MTRPEIHSHFVARFGDQAVSPRYLEYDLFPVEHRLGISFPAAYLAFLAAHGAVSSQSLLDLIVDSGAELHDLMAFIPAPELVEVSESSWPAGMRSELIAFAMDCMGSFFCFLRADLLGERPDDAPVWFFDHDYCSDEQIFESFDSWLASYFRLDDANSKTRNA